MEKQEILVLGLDKVKDISMTLLENGYYVHIKGAKLPRNIPNSHDRYIVTFYKEENIEQDTVTTNSDYKITVINTDCISDVLMTNVKDKAIKNIQTKLNNGGMA